jgi:hypothetical protein
MKTVAPRLRTQVVFTLGSTEWTQKGARGLKFVPLGWRLFDRCTGVVLASEPPSARPAPIDPSCPPPPPPEKRPELPDRLSPSQIMTAMEPVREAARACAKAEKLSGTLTLSLAVSPEGEIKEVRFSGPLAGSKGNPSRAEACLEKPLSVVRFPAFRTAIPAFDYPVLFRR